MENEYVINISRQFNTTPGNLFALIQKGVLFKLTGADEIEFDFREGGVFSLKFSERGHIFGSFEKIIPDEKIVLYWNVKGFYSNDEIDTEVDITIKKLETESYTLLTINHTGKMEEKSFQAKKSAWKEILSEIDNELKT